VAVRIRLKRMGKVRTPFYRIVVCDSRTKRDGRVIEEIGTYNPKTEPSTPTLKVAEPRRDKTEIFNEALKESHNEPKAGAVTKKAAKSDKGADKADRGAESKAEEVQRADKAHAEQASGAGDDAEKATPESTGSSETADSGEQAKSED
jgi:small subunit ribosomal protein S16